MNKRKFFRIAVDRRGQIRCGVTPLPCQVVNLSEKGFRLRAEGSFSPGDILHVDFALQEEQHIGCTVKTVYVQPPFVGGAIVRISPYRQTRLSQFIDEIYTLSLMGF